MSFFRKIAKLATKPRSFIEDNVPGADFILPIIGSSINPAAEAAYQGTKSYGQGNSLGDSLKSSVLSYAGNKIGSEIGASFIGDKLGTVGSVTGLSSANALPWNAADTGFGKSIGSVIGSSAANSVASTGVGSILGGKIGSSLATNSFGSPQDTSLASSVSSPFTPSQDDEQQAPASIQGLGSLTSDQASTNLATQGVYGGGNGPQESDYFLNLINRRLVDQSGQTSDIGSLKPIEQSYLQKLGLGGYDNSNSLLEAISKWHQQAA